MDSGITNYTLRKRRLGGGMLESACLERTVLVLYCIIWNRSQLGIEYVSNFYLDFCKRTFLSSEFIFAKVHSLIKSG